MNGVIITTESINMFGLPDMDKQMEIMSLLAEYGNLSKELVDANSTKDKAELVVKLLSKQQDLILKQQDLIQEYTPIYLKSKFNDMDIDPSLKGMFIGMIDKVNTNYSGNGMDIDDILKNLNIN